MVTLRIRSVLWFVAGMMLAVVSVWVFSAMRVAAVVNPAESSIVSVTPERVLDSRDPTNLGLPGPFVSQQSQKLVITGSVQTANGAKVVVPDGATGVLLNVTPVSATADGFISIEPGDATGQPTTSSLNFTAGEVNPNSVTVTLPTAGSDKGTIRITYDALGFVGPTTDILVDVVGYTTNAGLKELEGRINTNQGRLDTQLSRMDADVTLSHGGSELRANTASIGLTASYSATGSTHGGTGFVHTGLTGPRFLLEQFYGLKSIEYCIHNVVSGAKVTQVKVIGVQIGGPQQTVVKTDMTLRNTAGCYIVPVGAKGYDAYNVEWKIETPGAGTTLSFSGFTTKWAREGTL